MLYKMMMTALLVCGLSSILIGQNQPDPHPNLTAQFAYVALEQTETIEGWKQVEMPDAARLFGIVRAHEQAPTMNQMMLYTGCDTDNRVFVGIDELVLYPFKAFEKDGDLAIILRAENLAEIKGKTAIFMAIAHLTNQDVLELCTFTAAILAN